MNIDPIHKIVAISIIASVILAIAIFYAIIKYIHLLF